MAQSENAAAAFVPRRDDSTPGYEIWFVVVHDPVERIALWLRYTRYVPKPGDKPAQAILWASLFSATDPTRHAFNSRSFPLRAGAFGSDRIVIGQGSKDQTDAVLGPDYIVGEMKSPAGNLRWDLELQHDFAPHAHGPERLAKVARTHSIVISPFGRARGTVRLGQAKSFKLKNARLMFTHIWGTERVPELYWCYAPYLQSNGAAADNPAASLAAVEAIYVKPSALTPAVCFGSALTGDGQIVHDHALTRGVFGGNRFEYPAQSFRLNFGGQKVEVKGVLNQKQKTGYIYRGPDGTPFFIVQSDVSSVECHTKTADGRALRYTNPDFAAVEFHGSKPWPGVMYMDPYD